MSFRQTFGAVVASAAAIAIAGCGVSAHVVFGSDEQAAQAAVQRYVDNDDCSVATDRFLRHAYSDAPDARRACEDDVGGGWRAGHYRVLSSTAAGDTAVVVAEHLGETRAYHLVRAAAGWLLDGLEDSVAPRTAALGHAIQTEQAWGIDGRNVNTRLRVTMSHMTARRLSDGRCAVGARARIFSTSSAAVQIRANYFAIVNTRRRIIRGRTLSTGTARLAPNHALSARVGFRVPCATRISAIAFSIFGKGQPLLWPAPRRHA